LEEQQCKVQEQSRAGAESRAGIGEKELELTVEEKQEEKCQEGYGGAGVEGEEVAEA
jgi:hypothetical protein